MNKTFTIFKLYFTAPLHLGNEREDYAQSLHTMHSDAMYAALTAVLAKVGGLPTGFKGDLDATISSLFPFYQKDEKHDPVYFFPKWKKKFTLSENMIDLHKKAKKVQWLDIPYFEKQLHGEIDDLFHHSIEKVSSQMKGDYLTFAESFDSDFIQSEINPRVSVSRTGEEDAKPFYMERIRFIGKSGLFFLAEGKTKLLEKGLAILQEEGIGTDRNVGNGFFEYEKDKLTIDMPDDGAYLMNMGLFLPESKSQLESMLDDNCAYNLVTRGGWVTTPPNLGKRKNRVYMFEEGSVLKKINNDLVLGRIADLTPDIIKKDKTPIFRNGKAIFLPVHLENKNG